MDGFFRILKQTSFQLICTRLYLISSYRFYETYSFLEVRVPSIQRRKLFFVIFNMHVYFIEGLERYFIVMIIMITALLLLVHENLNRPSKRPNIGGYSITHVLKKNLD